MSIPYFLEILLHFEIPLPSKSRRITHPYKYRPRTLATRYEIYVHVCTGALYVRANGLTINAVYVHVYRSL